MRSRALSLVALLSLLGSAAIAHAQPPDTPPPPDAADPGQYAPPDGAPGDMAPEAPEPPPVPANGTVDVSFFYSNLAPYGHWVEHGSDGWVWLPYGMSAGWRPYTQGHWVLSDEGWLWVSTESFGWATYHYGRWDYDSQYGWLWVPGTDWGPAWVAWRNGGGYIGWAPLPPQVGFQAGVGISLGGVNLDAALGQDHFCFVEERSFLAPNIVTVVAPPARNVTIIRNTTNITKYTVVNNRVVNQGIAVDRVEKATGHSVERYQIAAVATGKARNTEVRGNQLSVFRPEVVKKANVAPPPVSARATGAPANLARQHQQETAALQKSQAAERTQLQQIHQTEQNKQPAAPTRQAGAAPSGQAPNDNKRQPADDARRSNTAGGASAPAGAGGGQLLQQHAAEVQAQQQQHQREQQQLAARQQAEKQRAAAAPRPQAQPRNQAPPKTEAQPKGGEPRNDKERKPEGAPPPQAR